ncbi:MAG: hypothetical protein ACTHKV_14835 [Flavipsychrobacter sp.]
MTDKVKGIIITAIKAFSVQQIISGVAMMVCFIVGMTRAYDGIIGKIGNLELEVAELKAAVNDIKNNKPTNNDTRTTQYTAARPVVYDTIVLLNKPIYGTLPAKLLCN